MRVLIAAGGSGGHIFPAIALARKLKDNRPDIRIKFLGSDKALDRRIFEKERFEYSLLSANKLPYKTSPSLLSFFIKLVFDIAKTFCVVMAYRPDVVVGFGGYAGGPALLLSRGLGIPTLVHEQNVEPGRANSFLFNVANRIAVSFKETFDILGANSARAVFTGNPVRAPGFKGDRSSCLKGFGFDTDRLTILVMGGSQGAHLINEVFLQCLSKMDAAEMTKLQVIHITGVRDYRDCESAYANLGIRHRAYSFIDNIEEAYCASDIIITRAGASAIFEAAAFGKPMILIPYPFAMSHQSGNSRVFSERGAAIMMAEKDLSAESLKKEVLGLLNDGGRRSAMAAAARSLSVPDAAGALAKEVLDMVKG